MPHARPQLTPAATSQGRQSRPRTGPLPEVTTPPSGSSSRASRARDQSLSATWQCTASRMKNATKMSRSAIRDSTNCIPSKQSSRPATTPSIVEPVSRRTSRTSTTIISEPTTAAATRQPNGSTPKAFSPSAISHFPRSGWTAMEAVSFHRPSGLPARIAALAFSPLVYSRA